MKISVINKLHTLTNKWKDRVNDCHDQWCMELVNLAYDSLGEDGRLYIQINQDSMNRQHLSPYVVKKLTPDGNECPIVTLEISETAIEDYELTRDGIGFSYTLSGVHYNNLFTWDEIIVILATNKDGVLFISSFDPWMEVYQPGLLSIDETLEQELIAKSDNVIVGKFGVKK